MRDEVHSRDQGDTQTGPETLQAADQSLLESGTPGPVQACVAGKGYHDTAVIAELWRQGIRTYIPERRQKVRRWTDKPSGYEAAFRGNQRR